MVDVSVECRLRGFYITKYIKIPGQNVKFFSKKSSPGPQKRAIRESPTYKLLVNSNKKEAKMSKELILFILNVVIELVKYILG